MDSGGYLQNYFSTDRSTDRIKLNSLKPSKVYQSSVRKTTARTYKVGDRLQPLTTQTTRIYGSRVQSQGTREGPLHYFIRLDSAYMFKRHIDQLRLSDTPTKTVSHLFVYHSKRTQSRTTNTGRRHDHTSNSTASSSSKQ